LAGVRGGTRTSTPNRRDGLLRASKSNPERTIMKSESDAGPRPAEFLTVSQLAEELAVADRTVRRWIDAGKLHIHRLGRQIRISREDADTFVGGCRR